MSQCIVTILLLCAFALLPQAGSTHDKAKWIHASTAEEIVNAFLSANGSGKPTFIKVAPGTYQFSTRFDSGRGPTSLPPVTGTIIVSGRDSANTLFAGSTELRILTVLAGGRLFISNLTLSGGAAFCVESEEGCPTPGGGAAANFGGVLTFKDCVLSGNSSSSSEGNTYMLGGAILSEKGYLLLDRTIVSENFARGRGGGLALIDGTASIRHSIISTNRVGAGGPSNFGVSEGGGIFVGGTRLTISQTTISGNHVGNSNTEWFAYGGGLFNNRGRISIRDSAIIENAAVPYASGGGILNLGDLQITNTTIGGNTVGTLGGGIYNEGNLTLQGVTIVRNDVEGSGRVGGISGPGFPESCQFDHLEGCINGGGGLWNQPPGKVVTATTLISNNTHGFPATDDCKGILASRGHNAVGSSTGCDLRSAVQSRPTYDLLDLETRVDELQDSGDAGNAHYPLLQDSPLIDAGGRISSNCDNRDQIQQRRRDGDHDGKVECDVGAIEF